VWIDIGCEIFGCGFTGAVRPSYACTWLQDTTGNDNGVRMTDHCRRRATDDRSRCWFPYRRLTMFIRECTQQACRIILSHMSLGSSHRAATFAASRHWFYVCVCIVKCDYTGSVSGLLSDNSTVDTGRQCQRDARGSGKYKLPSAVLQ
jgi:hypothetical protein